MQNSVNEFLTPRVIKVDEKSTNPSAGNTGAARAWLWSHARQCTPPYSAVFHARLCAVTEVEIDGVLHEYSAIEGVQEDVIEISVESQGCGACHERQR